LDKASGLMRLGILICFLGLVVLTQRFWFLEAWHWTERISRPATRHVLQGLWIFALVLFVGTFFNRLIQHFFTPGLGEWTVGLARVWLVASFFAFFALQLVGAAGWISHAMIGLIAPRSSSFEPGRRDFFRYAAYLAASVPFLAATYGFAAGRLKYKVQRVEVPIADLPKELDGLKIVQLSDIHIGDFMPRDEVRRAVEMANHLNPDLAVVTGDFVSDENDPLEVCIAELSKLRAPLGVWGCNGNHEIYAGAEDASQQLFSHYGMRLLRQENEQVEHRGARFNLMGVDYQRDHMTPGPHGIMLQGIEGLVRRDMPNVLLSHNPNSFKRAAELGIELSLAGHTHGGQVQFEIVDHSVTPARLITEFVAGLYHLPFGNGAGLRSENSGRADKKAFLYVNRGLGTFGMPVRIGVPPEITLLTLRSA
jgi:predicted MPP superfamily phosphohydrolase